jgi:hypothetical protein
MYLIFQQLGSGGLNLTTALIIAASFGLVFLVSSGNFLLRAFVVIFAATASGVYWSARPHLMTIFFGSMFLFVLESLQKNSNRNGSIKPAILMIFLMLLWVNSHGGFILGFILWGGYLGGNLVETVISNYRSKQYLLKGMEGYKPYFIAGIGMIFAGVINPMGVGVYTYPFKTVAIEALREYIQEWQSPNFHSISVQPFIWLIILILISLAYNRRKIAISDIFITSVLLYLSLTAGRNIALFALMTPVVVTRYLQDHVPSDFLSHQSEKGGFDRKGKSEMVKNFLHLGIVGVIFLAAVFKIASVYPETINQEYYATVFPVDAVGVLRQMESPGRLFNSYNWGGYLLWSLPEYPVFVDGRTDLFNDEIIGDWLEVVRFQQNWEDVLRKWNIELILMERDWLPGKLLAGYGWCKVYEDELSVLLEKCP